MLLGEGNFLHVTKKAAGNLADRPAPLGLVEAKTEGHPRSSSLEDAMTNKPHCLLRNESHPQPDDIGVEVCSIRLLTAVRGSMGKVMLQVALDANLVMRAEAPAGMPSKTCHCFNAPDNIWPSNICPLLSIIPSCP